MHAIAIRMGFGMLIGLITYFLLMFELGIAHINELHWANWIIQLVFMNFAIRRYFNQKPENLGSLNLGVAQGMRASVIGIGGFTIFMTIFLWLDPALLAAIRDESHLGTFLMPFTASIYILAEGLVISIFGSYLLTQLLGVWPMKKTYKPKV